MSDLPRTLWLDVSAGVAGDMILGAVIDAGASLEFVRSQIDQVAPGAVSVTVAPVTRAGMRAAKVSVEVLEAIPPRRTWLDVERLLRGADLDDRVRVAALAVFERLAGAEARVHGIAPDEVHFHEVGALDAIADVVGSCAGLADLGVGTVLAGPIALGSGTVRSEHGELPVPVPAVLEMVTGWTVLAGGSGELATPTGVALVTALAGACAALPRMRVDAVGVGAGRRDRSGRANVVRAVIGVAEVESVAGDIGSVAGGGAPEAIVEANVDDLDPRLWPGVLAALLSAGAQDAWLTPILMKKGRPAHTVHALGRAEDIPRLRTVLFEQTSTFGVRTFAVEKYAAARAWHPIDVAGQLVSIKVAYAEGTIGQATPEFADAERAAQELGRPIREVLRLADLAAAQAGLVVGRPYPPEGD